MEKQLKGYIPYQEKDYKKIWKNALVVVDANVILNFYRYSDKAREELWEILETIKERLWMPYQVGYEYCKNREHVIDKVQQSPTIIKEELDKELKRLEDKIQKVDNKDIKCKDEIIKIMYQMNEKISQMLDEEKKQQPNFEEKDEVLDKVRELFKEKCEEIAPDNLLKQIKEEANRRIQNKIPPGYKDYQKEENYGDYYIFYSCLQKAKKEKKDIIFITDDEKEDWYLKKEGKNKGARPELLQEFYQETNQLLFICTTKTFIKGYSKYAVGIQATQNIIEEIEDIHKKEEAQKEEMRRVTLKTSTRVRNSRSELFEKVIRMKILLQEMMYKEGKQKERLQEIEYIAQHIMQDIRYERYHGKILLFIDRLERGTGKERLYQYYMGLNLLNQILEEIQNE